MRSLTAFPAHGEVCLLVLTCVACLPASWCFPQPKSLLVVGVTAFVCEGRGWPYGRVVRGDDSHCGRALPVSPPDGRDPFSKRFRSTCRAAQTGRGERGVHGRPGTAKTARGPVVATGASS